MSVLQNSNTITPSLLISIISLIIGTSAFVLSLLNFLRDRGKVTVKLQWDAGVRYEGSRSNVQETWGHIYVTNEGRRPIFVTFVGLRFPKEMRVYNLLPYQPSTGIKLSEGDAPMIIKVPQDELLEQHAKDWKKIYAVATDSTGRRYVSRKNRGRPEWVAQLEWPG